jgi:Fe-S cluster biogenesis protein NfuA
VFIQTEDTPNPNALKFYPGQGVMESGTLDMPNSEAASRSPLALRLFAVKGIEGVFYGSDFITLTKIPDGDWYVIKPQVLGIIMEHFVSGLPLFNERAVSSCSSVEDTEIEKEIRDLLETKVRPAVAQDGGDIVFERFQDGVVYVSMQGACSGCPSSNATLKSGIENMLKHYIPEVTEVRAI